jgi:hypothetical protein
MNLPYFGCIALCEHLVECPTFLAIFFFPDLFFRMKYYDYILKMSQKHGLKIKKRRAQDAALDIVACASADKLKESTKDIMDMVGGFIHENGGPFWECKMLHRTNCSKRCSFCFTYRDHAQQCKADALCQKTRLIGSYYCQKHQPHDKKVSGAAASAANDSIGAAADDDNNDDSTSVTSLESVLSFPWSDSDVEQLLNEFGACDDDNDESEMIRPRSDLHQNPQEAIYTNITSV